MSTGDKKPGTRDISDLKARLGMLNKGPAGPKSGPAPGGPANPFAKKPVATTQPAIDLTANPDAMIGDATAVVRIAPGGRPEPFAPSTPPAPSQAPAPSHAPAPSQAVAPSQPPAASAPASPFNFNQNMFAKKAEPAQPAAPKPAAAPRRQQPAVAQAAAPEVAAAPVQEANASFAHPLQQGTFGVAAASVDLSAAEEDALASFEGRQRGIKPAQAIMGIIFFSGLCLVAGFAVGDIRSSRKMVNQQIQSSIEVKKRTQPIFTTLNQYRGLIESIGKSPREVQWDKIAMIPETLPSVDAGVLLSTPVPLNKDLTRMLTVAAGDFHELFTRLQELKTYTLGKDKAELKALATGNAWITNQRFAVTFTPRDPKTPSLEYIPPIGKVVAVKGKWELDEKGGFNVLPVQTREQEDAKMVRLQHIIIIDKNDLMSSGKSNVMSLYTKRVEHIKKIFLKISGYEKQLQELLNKQSAREKVMEF